MNLTDFIIIGILLTLVFLIIIRMFKKSKSREGSCMSCRGCPMGKYCNKK